MISERQDVGQLTPLQAQCTLVLPGVLPPGLYAVGFHKGVHAAAVKQLVSAAAWFGGKALQKMALTERC